MTRWKILVAIAWLALMGSGSAGATVIVDHRLVGPGGGDLTPGETFQVEVRVRWDGQGSLAAIFASTLFDAQLLELVSNTPFPSSIFSIVDPSDPENPLISMGLSRFGGQNLRQPGDPPSVLRTVQYGGLIPADPRAATTGRGRLITTLTFRLIGLGGSYQLVIAGLGAGEPGAVGDSFVVGTHISFTMDGLSETPEPGTGTLVGIGLLGLGARSRRRGTLDLTGDTSASAPSGIRSLAQCRPPSPAPSPRPADTI